VFTFSHLASEPHRDILILWFGFGLKIAIRLGKLRGDCIGIGSWGGGDF